jgi:predicted branched-subunit amino acid permease
MEAGTRSFVGLGIRSSLALPGWIVALSFLGVGSLARDVGHPIGAAILSTVAIWAAPAQLILYGSLAGGGLVTAAALAVALSAIRLLPMTLAIWPYLRRPGQSLLTQLGLAHFIAATVWIDSMRRLPGLPPEGRIPYFVGFGATCLSLSIVATALGYLLVGALPLPFAAGLLCLTPIYFTVSMMGGARTAGDWAAIGLGLGLVPIAAAVVGRDYDLLATGLVGGASAYLIDRQARRRERAPG